MMVIGIGGCTALLVTGYGIKDTIADIADMQYEEVQLYDMSVTLKEGYPAADAATFLNLPRCFPNPLRDLEPFCVIAMDLTGLQWCQDRQCRHSAGYRGSAGVYPAADRRG